MTSKFTPGDLQQIASLGIPVDSVYNQLKNFHDGFPHIKLSAPATPDNGGILQLSDDDIARYIDKYATLGADKIILKFVPASGAATRMFKDLYAFSSTYFGVAYNFGKEFPSVKEFLENIRSFAFFNDLKACMKDSSLDIEDYLQRGDYTTVINCLLKEQYLGYGLLPKGLLKFHRYGSSSRTPVEEHIVEGIEYACGHDRRVNILFTVSPEHRALFRKKVNEVRANYEHAFGVKLRVSYSEQKHSTDTIAVDEYNEPIRDEEGRLVFRPGGHGALIENLNDCHADIVFIKNIDNVVPDWLKHTTVVYKKALAGMLLDLQEKTLQHVRTLKTGATKEQIGEIMQFAHNELHIDIPEQMPANLTDQRKLLFNLLNRPMRICGMVKNQGEPGGGPFFVEDSKGRKSLQIVETAQVNLKNPEQQAIFSNSTHFNPVDLVCTLKDYRGRRFDLRRFVDPSTGFISKKSKGAVTVKSQELPGLWNGAMANWITLFVEVPLATFNPVKTVNDLLRKEHQEV
ncbi:MAG: DUF4301 family protein [Bacteroidales bacterium]|nr:DUF4301 family protein [Bacteroidales bacterium]